MILLNIILAIATATILVALVLYVLFGQITVRKLRKNPETLCSRIVYCALVTARVFAELAIGAAKETWFGKRHPGPAGRGCPPG